MTGFLKYCAEFLTFEQCSQVCKITNDQSKNTLWYELRFGRITVSNVYDAAQCNKLDGSLVEKIMSIKAINTTPIKRGKELECYVLAVFARDSKKQNGEDVTKWRLILKNDYPIFGASPDGITKTALIEIKCSSKEKTVSRFYSDGKITNKYKAQLHVQMLFAKKSVNYFIIANPHFESNKQITVIKEIFDKNFTIAVMKKAKKFWEKAIFPKLVKESVNTYILCIKNVYVYIYCKLPNYILLSLYTHFTNKYNLKLL